MQPVKGPGVLERGDYAVYALSTYLPSRSVDCRWCVTYASPDGGGVCGSMHGCEVVPRVCVHLRWHRQGHVKVRLESFVLVVFALVACARNVLSPKGVLGVSSQLEVLMNKVHCF